MARGKSGRPTGGRPLHQRVKTAKRRTLSSTRWLERQLNDPYVAAAKVAGYRSRAAFKLVELDDRYKLLAPGGRVVDLGAAPGGWTQVAVERVRSGSPGGGVVVAIDLSAIDPVPGAIVMQGDATTEESLAAVRAVLGGPADVVLSDMAAPATGHAATDHLRIMLLCESAAEVAMALLRPGGHFVAKVLKGGTEAELLARLKRRFRVVRHAKPAASRADSAESYVVALDLKREAPPPPA